MKRYGNLWHLITEFENLWLAAKKAQKGKRFKENVLKFNLNLESELLTLHKELLEQTYSPGQYHSFEITEPKTRLISAAPYRDRVVHHALCNVISPILEKSLIPDTYANRVGFGTHKALKRFTEFLRSSRYILQCDIRKYFPSIDHDILKSLIRNKIKCKSTLWLIDKIIDGSNPQEIVPLYFPDDNLLSPLNRKMGLPIGNLTSQTFANFYLNDFDHFIKENLKVKKYLRYVDDFALFSDDYEQLAQAREQIQDYLITLRLQIHPSKNHLFETQYGATFVGYRILPTHIRVRSDNLIMGRRRLRYKLKKLNQNHLTAQHFYLSLNAWFAHLSHADSWQLREQILNFLEKKGISDTLVPSLKQG
ncbi:MAG: hypothetical protein RLZZ435_14 [Cyanobacteriota bacterium]|jgi:retron-type reverse transcriptase